MRNKTLAFLLVFTMLAPAHSALEFDAAGNERVVIADPGTGSVLDFGSGESITISAWVYPTNVTDYKTIVAKGRTVSITDANYVMRMANGQEFSLYYYTGSAYHVWDTSTSQFTANEWQHVAITYTFGNASSIVAYVRGSSVPGAWTLGDGTAAPIETNEPLHIGQLFDGETSEAWGGQIDDVRIYNRILSASEIESLAHSRSRLNITEGLVASFRLDEGPDGQTAAGSNSVLDRSGNGLVGTPTNGPIYRTATWLNYP